MRVAREGEFVDREGLRYGHAVMNAPAAPTPVYETALLSLIEGGAVLREDLDPMEVAWLDASHPVFLFDVARCDPQRLLDTSARAWSLTGVEHVDVCVAGGSRDLFEALTHARHGRTAEPTRGLVWVSDRGEITFDGASRRAVDTMRNAFRGGVPSQRAPGELGAAITRSMRLGAAQVEELSAFQDRLSTGKPTVTYGLLGVMVALFAGQWLLGDASIAVDVRMGALLPGRAFDEPWRLVSHAFLHASAQHILFNGMTLYSLGSFYERLLGRARFAALFTLAAIGGGIVANLSDPRYVVVGASGALWGLLGVSGALALRPGSTLPKAFQPMFRRNTFGNLALQVIVSMVPHVSWQAHLGGGLVGFALMITGLLSQSESERVERAWRVAAIIALVLCGLCVIAALVTGRAWELTSSR